MYSVKRVEDIPELTEGSKPQGQHSNNYHQDVSPELKEVMHLLKAMESGAGLKR